MLRNSVSPRSHNNFFEDKHRTQDRQLAKPDARSHRDLGAGIGSLRGRYPGKTREARCQALSVQRSIATAGRRS